MMSSVLNYHSRNGAISRNKKINTTFLVFVCLYCSEDIWLTSCVTLYQEIADYISAGKEDRARIRVEHIIREDYLVEAMELLEMYCDLLLARFGLIQTQKYDFYVFVCF